jgi:hypothetical protein|tara:strand:- start:318 stop:878 length:561 start_codon:yes stop_codon:yes gene_type:complete
MKCINCGAPRAKSGSADLKCAYCGSVSSISLSHESSFFDGSLKQSIRERLESDKSYDDDPDAQVSLIVIYLLEGLTEMSEQIINQLSAISPREPRYMILKAVTTLSQRGIRKSKISKIEESVSLLNMAAGFSSEIAIGEIAELGTLIKKHYYERNGIRVHPKLHGLLGKVGTNVKENSVMSSILLN